MLWREAVDGCQNNFGMAQFIDLDQTHETMRILVLIASLPFICGSIRAAPFPVPTIDLAEGLRGNQPRPSARTDRQRRRASRGLVAPRLRKQARLHEERQRTHLR